MNYIKSLRRIIKVGNSYYCNLPIKFIKEQGLNKGDVLLVHGKNILTVQPINPETINILPMKGD